MARIDIAKRIYEYRKAAGLSQEEVSAKIGVSRQAVSKWECAESSPDTDNLIALAELYGVTVDELLFADPEEADVIAASISQSDADFAESHETQAAEDATGQTFTAAVPGDTAKDYVDISLTNGVHVRDSKKGEEVHVDWNGVHIDNEKEHVHIDFAKLARMIREFRKDQA